MKISSNAFSGNCVLSHAAELERLCQEEERRKEEELKKLEGMDESERIEYLQEEEDRRNKEEERKRKEEEAALRATEEARLQAQLLDRYRLIFTAQYNSAQLESLVKWYQAAVAMRDTVCFQLRQERKLHLFILHLSPLLSLSPSWCSSYRQMALLQQQLDFKRGLMLEAGGLEKTQGISRPWIYSYFTLLQLLGLNQTKAESMTP